MKGQSIISTFPGQVQLTSTEDLSRFAALHGGTLQPLKFLAKYQCLQGGGLARDVRDFAHCQ